MTNLEKEILAHRYLYYVLAEPILGDYQYDMLERKAQKSHPETSPVWDIGSSLEGSYPEEVKQLARSWLK